MKAQIKYKELLLTERKNKKKKELELTNNTFDQRFHD